MSHTPTPWTYFARSDGSITITGPKNQVRYIATLREHASWGPAGDNARFIIRACNSHDDLLEALEKISNYSSIAHARKLAKEAIRKAKE